VRTFFPVKVADGPEKKSKGGQTSAAPEKKRTRGCHSLGVHKGVIAQMEGRQRDRKLKIFGGGKVEAGERKKKHSSSSINRRKKNFGKGPFF